jgi:hypothetical protein
MDANEALPEGLVYQGVPDLYAVAIIDPTVFNHFVIQLEKKKYASTVFRYTPYFTSGIAGWHSFLMRSFVQRQ